jgi:hypothetical protein
MRARHVSPLAMWFKPALEREMKTLLVEESLDDVRESAQQRAAARLGATHTALGEVPPRGDPRVLVDAALPAPLGGGASVAAAVETAAVEAATAP